MIQIFQLYTFKLVSYKTNNSNSINKYLGVIETDDKNKYDLN